VVLAEVTATGSSEESLIECDWTIEVHDEYRTICVEFRLAIKDEWDGGDTIEGRGFFAPAVDSNVAFQLVAGNDLEAYTGPRSEGSIPVVLLLTADCSASGVFNFITSGDLAYWSWPKPCHSPHTSKWPGGFTALAARSTPEGMSPIFVPLKEGIIARP